MDELDTNEVDRRLEGANRIADIIRVILLEAATKGKSFTLSQEAGMAVVAVPVGKGVRFDKKTDGALVLTVRIHADAAAS